MKLKRSNRIEPDLHQPLPVHLDVGDLGQAAEGHGLELMALQNSQK